MKLFWAFFQIQDHRFLFLMDFHSWYYPRAFLVHLPHPTTMEDGEQWRFHHHFLTPHHSCTPCWIGRSVPFVHQTIFQQWPMPSSFFLSAAERKKNVGNNQILFNRDGFKIYFCTETELPYHYFICLLENKNKKSLYLIRELWLIGHLHTQVTIMCTCPSFNLKTLFIKFFNLWKLSLFLCSLILVNKRMMELELG